MSSEFTLENASDAWSRLSRTVSKYDIALFLGAGSSTGNRLPGWQEFTTIVGGWPEVRKYIDAGVSLATLLGIARSRIRTDGEWQEAIRPALYSGFLRQISEMEHTIAGLEISNFGRKDEKSRENVRKFFTETNPALVEIVRLCSVSRGTSWQQSDHIGACLTTNIDFLIQSCDRAFHGSPRILRTVERASAETEAGKVPLYHLHGYLRPERTKASREAADRLVLTEAEYLARNDDPYSWANAVLHWAAREFPVLFIGCSMTDELIRRALHRTYHQHLADIQAEGKYDKVPEEKKRRHFAVMLQPSDPDVTQILNASLGSLGVWPLWLNDFGELPSRLRALRAHLENER
jgi:hypothetical protein